MICAQRPSLTWPVVMQSYKETSQKVSTSAMQDKFRTPRPHLKSRHLEIILDVEGEWGGEEGESGGAGGFGKFCVPLENSLLRP